MLLAATFIVNLTSCDNDDDDPVVETATTADKVAGSYSINYSLATAKYFSNMYTDESGNSVVLTQEGDTTVSVAFTSSTWGTFAINAGVSVENGVYTISGEGTVEMAGMSGTKSTYEATIEGTFADGAFTSLVFTAPSVMGGTAISVFTGEAPAYAIAGKYGTTYSLASATYFKNMYTDESDNNVVLEAISTDSVSVAYTSSTWGTFAINAGVSVENGVYTISGEGTVEMAGMSGTKSTYEATIEGTFADGAFTSLVFTAPSVMGGTAISVFTGEAPAYAIAGKYGTTYSLASATYFKNMYTDESDNNVVLEAISTDSVSVAYTSSTWGTFAINAAVSVENGVYTISGEGTVEMSGHGEAKSYDATVEGTFADGAFTSLVFTAPSVMGGTTITVYNTTADAAYSVAGSYTGTLSAYLSELSMDGGSAENQTVKIAYAEDGVVSVTVPSFTYGGAMTLPSATITGVTVKANEDGSYTLGESEFSETVTVDDAEKTYAGKINGTIAADGSAEIVYDVNYGAMPFTITFTFKTVTE